MNRYEVAIIGAGIAGAACSINLEKEGIHCILLEKRKTVVGKVCGDGLTFQAVNLLNNLGINPDRYQSRRITHKLVYKNGVCSEISYSDLFGIENEYGMSRDILDTVLLEKAQLCGADTVMNHCCTTVRKAKKGYIIDNEIYANKVVVACGAAGRFRLKQYSKNDLQCGISSRIYGKLDFRTDAFHFFYDAKIINGYAWLFPVGNDLWNIGVWGNATPAMRNLYCRLEKQICGDYHITYDRRPRGALIGTGGEILHRDTDGIFFIGDCAGAADNSTGEGVTYALIGAEQAAAKITGELIED